MQGILCYGSNCGNCYSISTQIDPGYNGFMPSQRILSGSILRRTGRTETLPALYALQEFAERHLEGRRESRRVTKSDLPRTRSRSEMWTL